MILDEGLLILAQKYGRPNEATPAKWNTSYKDFNAPLENGHVASEKGANGDGKANGENGSDILPLPATGTSDQAAEGGDESLPPSKITAAITDADEGKKRKRHEDETPEQRAERKRKKKEKKEKRKSKGMAEEAAESD